MAHLDVLIPTFDRPAALAVMITSLIGQTHRDFRVVVSDQSDEQACERSRELQAVLRVLRARGHAVEVHHHLPRRGLAEQRDFLLAQVRARYALFLDDDLILEPEVMARMLRAIADEGCGFVGCAVTGLSFLEDVRPHEQEIEFWDEPVRPEVVQPQWPQWQRYRLHNAANVYHLQQRLRICGEAPRKYKVAWVGGCVLYDTQALRDCGGFGFWRELPSAHCGEDVLAQLRVMARFGGCGLLPSGVYHQELPTTVVKRHVDAPNVLPVEA
jgi:glycosyltransferase involved in cell wall biosynthesis